MLLKLLELRKNLSDSEASSFNKLHVEPNTLIFQSTKNHR